MTQRSEPQSQKPAELLYELAETYPIPELARAATLFEIEQGLYEALHRIRNEIKGELRHYNNLRPELYRQKMAEKGLGWCTRHNGTVPLAELTLLYIKDSWDEYGIHTACVSCREKVLTLLARQGDVSEAERFDACEVVERSGKYYRINGTTPFDLTPRSRYLSTEEVRVEWGIPPEVQFSDFHGRKLSVNNVQHNFQWAGLRP